MRHAVLGAGGVGGLIGGALSRAGFPVTLILRPETLARHPQELSVSSTVLGDFTAPVRLSASLDEPVDVLWVTVKATQLEEALSSIPADHLGGALIVPLLNGVEHVAALRSRFPGDQVVAGVIRVESERVRPGEIRQPSAFAALQLASGTSAARVHELAEEVRGTGLTCEVVVDETTMLWGKLAFLAPLALSTTAMSAPLGAVRDDAMWRARMEACLDEALDAAEHAGARLDRETLLTTISRLPEGMRSSMQKDVEAGLPPELDAIGGPIVRLGRAHGFNVSATEGLTQAVSAKVGAGAG